MFGDGMTSMRVQFLESFLSSFTTQADYDMYKALLAEHPINGTEMAQARAFENMKKRIEWIARDSDALLAFVSSL